ncbi:pyruvate/2-oxoglutarate dehydrogenase complex, dihydrolipoamide acyltransferase component [Chthonomonas calidirosea]|uniref:dihydrolipoamide acetyltransferase family protein n=1 Tax=Chthonomonas calidirosea TaxID=454171 RepID=UPI0006DD40C4|nr:dihydrolipoamide acetyltransferase family protein [Chthonomonas calidirosea]CEK17589.1 pyruvate/2-oxoglutarate dehydrogenase complex, dihydrolipoamide acyltransferase component [Chthonomonas calidirosea]
MAQLIVMPQLGNTMEEGTILRWLKAEGEEVRKGEPLLEVETDKASMEVEAEADGVLLKILAQPNTTVPIRQPIAIVGAPGEDVSSLLSSELRQSSVPSVEAAVPASVASVAEPSASVIAEGGSLRISPRARRLAEAKGVPLAALEGRGSGPEGRIIERDVQAYLAAELQVSAPRPPRFTPLAARLADDLGVAADVVAAASSGSRVRSDDVRRHVEARQSQPSSAEQTQDFEEIPLAGMRRRIADNMVRSAFSAPHVTLVTEVDMSACSELRSRLLPEVERIYGVRLSFTDMLVKAVARALEEHPRLNATLQGDVIRLHKSKNIGVAVALEEGLVVPVLKHVESLTLGQVAAQLKPLIERVRSGKFSPEDVSDGTFTITNLGPFHVDSFNPILVPGQAAILGVGRIQEKPVVRNGAIEVRPCMNLCLSFDHRQVDGAPAALFLQRLCEILESPYSLLI